MTAGFLESLLLTSWCERRSTTVEMGRPGAFAGAHGAERPGKKGERCGPKRRCRGWEMGCSSFCVPSSSQGNLPHPHFLRQHFLGLYLEMQSVTCICTLCGGLHTHRGMCAKFDEELCRGSCLRITGFCRIGAIWHGDVLVACVVAWVHR